ncbi:MAG: hypothetical protein JWR67_3133 [Mucilaginibacter sp.]|nr:hypothetical protein [Mucilaginibacter sp.]
MTLKKNAYKIILLAITVLTVLMGVLILISPPAIFPDPSWGFQVMRSMQMGCGFNLIIGPNPADISKNTASFLSWWSPGQYLVPYFFKSLFSVNTGQASAITITIGNLSGLAGFYCFFKKIGFTKLIAAISLVFIMIQQSFWIPYAFYNGGEVLLFGFEGWFLYGCVALKKPDIKLLLFVLFSGWLGFLCKSSFMWIYASGLICLWVRLSANQNTLIAWIKKGLWLGIPAIISLAAVYIFYLSKGENPASSSGGFKLTWEALGFPLASPLLAGFSVDDLLNGLIYQPDGQQLLSGTTIAMLVLLAVVSLLLIVILIRYIPNNNYRLFITVFYAVSILFFSYSFLRQAAISYEGRHFRLIGILIVPGVIYMISRIKLYGQIAFLLLCLGIAYNSYVFARAAHHGNSLGAHGISGLSQQFIDQPSLNYMMTLDRQKTNAVFVFISADIGLEIAHNRIITIDPFDENTQNDLVPYLGHNGPIYMLLPINYTGKKAMVMSKYFPNYKTFTPTRLSKNYVLYSAQ